MQCDLLPDRVDIGGVTMKVVDLPHGQITSAGLRFEADGRSIVYFTDFNDLPHEAETLIEGCDVWIVDAVRRNPHPTHPHLDKTLHWIAKLGPKQAILTHMDQSMDYRELLAELPDGVIPGHDGMEIIL